MKLIKQRKLSGNIIGIILMLTMVLAALIMSGLVKSLNDDINFRLMLFCRFIFSLPILYAFGWYVRGNDLMKIKSRNILFCRVSIGLIGICLWFSALQNAEFGQVTALTQSSALFVALFAPIFLSEKIGAWRVSAIISGLIGIILITNPFDGALTVGVYLALGSGVNGAILSIILRKLGNTDEPVSVAIWHNSIGAIVFGISLLLVTPELPIFNFNLLFVLITIGVAGSFLQLTFTYAFKFGEAVVLAPIRYLSVPGAIVAGLIIWSEVPSNLEILGSCITVMSCVVIAWRELIKKADK
ncbi:MAG: DMT family transporter [Candidatus Puniceispirillales bacterium]